MTFDKKVLRAQLRAARDGFFTEAKPSLKVPDALRARFGKSVVMASYLPVGSEPDPAPLVDAARAAGCSVALAWVTDLATPMQFRLWDADTEIEAGPFGLRQPPHSAPAVSPDIILTPLVGFDRHGNRIGQGAGHYDRAFAAYPNAWRVGLALAVQEVDRLVPDPWDVPLHAIATDTEWIVTAP